MLRARPLQFVTTFTSEHELIHKLQVDMLGHDLLNAPRERCRAALPGEVNDPVPPLYELSAPEATVQVAVDRWQMAETRNAKLQCGGRPGRHVHEINRRC